MRTSATGIRRRGREATRRRAAAVVLGAGLRLGVGRERWAVIVGGAKSAEQQELEAFYAKEKDAITRRSRAWQAAIAQARADALPRTASGDCPHRVDPTFAGVDKSLEGLGIETLPALSGSPSLLVKAPELSKMLSARGRDLMKPHLRNVGLADDTARWGAPPGPQRRSS